MTLQRGLLIAALVLVPFAALVAFGFSLLKDPPPIVLQEVRLPPPAPIVAEVIEPVRPVVPLRPPLPIEVAVVAPPNPAEPEPAPVDLSPQVKRLPMIASVQPMVHQCFLDISERVREPMRVTVGFNTTAEGSFESVVIKKVSWQDPHLIACIQDSFEEARFEPSGFVLRRQTHTFTFAGPDAGH